MLLLVAIAMWLGLNVGLAGAAALLSAPAAGRGRELAAAPAAGAR
jgi:predicted cobalt transporter CbtA